jgi:hypothetical protein
VVVCGETEEKKEEDDVETEAADERHRKPRCVCGEEIEKIRKKKEFDLFLLSKNINFAP